MNKISFIKAGKYEDIEEKRHLEVDAGQRCLFGFCWWFWLPRVRISTYNWDFMWLCFMFTFWSDK